MKFSGPGKSAGEMRWADLLVCEHPALETLAHKAGIRVATTRIHRFGGRTFLEVERFDRHGLRGRSPVASLGALAALGDTGDANWVKASEGLGTWLKSDVLPMVQVVAWFGRPIANSDMHGGNLAFRPGLELAPVYDMLPMAYGAARGGELPSHEYTPPTPMPSERAHFRAAAIAAIELWRLCSKDTRISRAFRQICGQNLDRLERLLEREG